MTAPVSLRRGVAWLFAGSAGEQLLSFAFGIVLARLLAPEAFGMLLTIQVFTGIAGFVAGGGMGQALVRAKAPTKQDYDVVFTLQLLVGCAIYAFFFAIAPWLARWYDEPVYTDLLRLSALSFVIRPLVNMPSNLLYREMRFKAQTAANVATLVVSSAVSIGLAWRGDGVWALVWGGLAGSLFQAAVLARLAHWRPGLSAEFRRAGDMARYGLLVSSNDLVDYAKSKANIFILSQSLGPQSVGLFNKSESLARMPFSFVSGSVYKVAFRALAAEQDNLDKCRYVFQRSVALVAVYGTPFYVGLHWVAGPLVRGVYGPHWLPAAAPLEILIFAWPFWLVANLCGAVAAAKDRLGRELQIQMINLAITAAAVIVALPWGIAGVAWAMVVAAVPSALLMWRLAASVLELRLADTLRALGPALALNLPLAAALALADHLAPPALRAHDLLYVATLGGLGACVYLGAMLLLPLAELAGERERLLRLLRRGAPART
ncbi:lipopolysaccharide biosynthesis protein [Rubrivivax gelatinosus]|uniref:O-antigen/teichoic acid export membrane protein n=1 Tax=Rubrivivax gelatinosus TaxID=28068 RepID=A0A4R2MXW3_RUBGE|nr:lipopolysaccharide biosynthesis protein [Rubrivivax gelatinosus]MBK1686100.1 lipopolysaccharide biosynthesis protein [Rubrivivax gelatinosus]TCP05593.1 O-antigen/teichoic acid export membrane protein [Rubrivivax gelatinosus]